METHHGKIWGQVICFQDNLLSECLQVSCHISISVTLPQHTPWFIEFFFPSCLVYNLSNHQTMVQSKSGWAFQIERDISSRLSLLENEFDSKTPVSTLKDGKPVRLLNKRQRRKPVIFLLWLSKVRGLSESSSTQLLRKTASMSSFGMQGMNCTLERHIESKFLSVSH